ncbi:hypothetical protein HAINFHK1212_0349 [Haemophilus influenzae HK1212]|uniref:Uncharacterized protein n=1 Tax=Haemophilus influenzae HK1212 TaxID=456482 RepID=A0A7G2JZJ4_HAEIF|nr:hypothetical protein HAINFHK1212_0349 [Haemophilus influenzae HK1212]
MTALLFLLIICYQKNKKEIMKMFERENKIF